jgi:hypothetical protein
MRRRSRKVPPSNRFTEHRERAAGYHLAVSDHVKREGAATVRRPVVQRSRRPGPRGWAAVSQGNRNIDLRS